MSLLPGARLGSYEIIRLLGAGGMGEVYKARDPRLNRFIAIKVLPGASAADVERRERFEREAQAIAALSHPNIVTIHSVEEADGVFLLTMELVEGRSLAEALPKAGLPLDRLLKIATPVADAVAAAHQKGITHRDLKPANIMLGEGEHEGRIKVLDFGLAKLADADRSVRLQPDLSISPTLPPAAPLTGEGRILGTVAYMSPEQAEGKTIDARSDLFSLGVILYEMATGQRPFTGDTNISIISSIVKDTPKSVTELNPTLPRDLARIVRRALTKDLDRRYQTAKDLRNDLEELKASLDSGELLRPTASSGPLPRDGGVLATRPRRIVALAMAAVVILGLAGGFYWLGRRQPEAFMPAATGPSIQDLQITQLTTSGIAERPAISPDGKYVAYIQQSPLGDAVGGSVWIRQVATSSNVQILPPEAALLPTGLTITPDGSYIDYVMGGGIGRRELWRVPLLGGTPKKLIDRVDTPIGWSPDGRQMAFVRNTVQSGLSEAIVADADGGNPRVLTPRRTPLAFDSLSVTFRPSVRPAWSPDGRFLAVPGSSFVGSSFQVQIVFLDTSTGVEQAVPTSGNGSVFGLDWLDAGSLMVNQAAEPGAPRQFWRLSYPRGARTRLTNDLSTYMGVSITAARDSFVTARADNRGAISVGDGAGANVREVASAVSGVGNVAWAGDRLLFTNNLSGHRAISSVAPDGRTHQEIVSQGRDPTATSDGRTIVFTSSDPARPGLWKTTDGGRPVQVTPRRVDWPSVTGDDRHVVFISSEGGLQSLWMVSIDGGTPTRVANRFASRPALSPDGKALTFSSRDDQDQRIVLICDLSDCTSPRPISVPQNITVQKWTPDGKGIAYVTETPRNIWIQPVDGKPARQLTHFTDDRYIVDFAWSHDGTRLAIARVTTTNDIVLFKGLRK